MAEVEALTLTVTEAAVVLGISRTTAYECVRRGELRAVRLGRRLVVPRAAVTELLAGTTPTANRPAAKTTDPSVAFANASDAITAVDGAVSSSVS